MRTGFAGAHIYGKRGEMFELRPSDMPVFYNTFSDLPTVCATCEQGVGVMVGFNDRNIIIVKSE